LGGAGTTVPSAAGTSPKTVAKRSAPESPWGV
jgi:hypothetical protein